MSKILVTGGAGYIGTHTVLELLATNHQVVVIDNLCNASLTGLKRVEKLCKKTVDFYEVDLLNIQQVREVFKNEPDITAVIHFAALKAVGESVAQPLRYYNNNLVGSINLFQVMQEYQVNKLVFSSSATVYGIPEKLPLDESCRLAATNPYGHTKQMMEQILLDTGKALGWSIVLLRYFNPVGAHASGDIGEDPAYPNNLVPFLTQVAAGQRKEVVIFGNDWPTKDGTGVRDYIHIVDLAQGHLKALEKIQRERGQFIYNLGTGTGYSVLEMIQTLGKILHRPIPYRVGERRTGDVAEVVACVGMATRELNWSAQYGLTEMLASAWKWQSKNPRGFKD